MSAWENEISLTVAEVVNFMKIQGSFAPAMKEVLERKAAVEGAKKLGISVSSEELQRGADVFRALHDLHNAKETEEWIQSIGITQEVFEDHLETNLFISKLKDELEKQADTGKYLESELIRKTVREAVFRDWLNDFFK